MADAQIKAKKRAPNRRENDLEAILFFNKICNVLNNADLKWVEDNSDVKVQTMRNWINGDTYLPTSRTLFAVATAIGFKISAIQRKGFMVPKRLKSVK